MDRKVIKSVVAGLTALLICFSIVFTVPWMSAGEDLPQSNPQVEQTTPQAPEIEEADEDAVTEADKPVRVLPVINTQPAKPVQNTGSTGSSGSHGNTGNTPSTPAPSVPDTSVTESVAGLVGSDGALTQAVTMTSSEGVQATVPAGVKVSADKLTLTVTEKQNSDSDVTLEATERLDAYDVHIAGVAADNTTPIAIDLGEVLAVGLNKGNLSLYHVENGRTVQMTEVDSPADFTSHNQFAYSPENGALSVAMTGFSEVAVAYDTTAAWEGNIATAFAGGTGTESDPYIIANADQLAYFGAVVGGMNIKDANDNTIVLDKNDFEGKFIKLIADINLGDDEDNNDADKIFYPIGYYNTEGTYEKGNTAITSGFRNFEGTFDGNGHTISNFYQNTWEMKGDHDWYDATLQYYRDGMGLFGKVYGGTVKNLTVDNFSSDGEIATTGVIAAYADGATFENIAITNCNPRVYNIGNGGIVGCVGWYAKEAGMETTFKNITVDNSNKISALWGSYDVACGGIVGQYYPTSGQSSANSPKNAGIHFENCHVSAVMDVYNDVCANYQYYAYRYTGMLIGSVRENVTVDGHVYPKMDGITAEGCTVHFGTWNDYYYCEIIDNTTASYTHDYQMSRLTEIKAIDGTTITYLDDTTGTVPASGRANYVIVDYTKGHGTENATCYHFKDGAVWTHDMGGIQTGIDENGDGKDDLKEDKQHIYLEFNNLVTGYGWGVTTKAVGDLAGVTILDREVADSVVKFEKADNIADSYMADKQISIGELFKAADIEDNKLKIKPENVQVTVSPVEENGTVSATYTPDTTDWTQGTLTFNGTGAATVTITDYYFCTPTTITVNVTERQPEVKFDKLFTGDFLYRVGNENTVKLSSLFKAKEGAEIGTVSVTVEALNGTAASGTYTSNATWTDSTIQFNGIGVVKVTITDNDYCTPTELILEVVSAKNATTATSATESNIVLLNDISSGFSVSGKYGFYGNGFTVTLNPASHSTAKGNGYAGYIHMNGGTIDNVKIVGPVYAESNIYQSQALHNGSGADAPADYFRNGICVDGGDAVIVNSYISGTRVPVLIKAGNNVTIKNSHISGGAYANIEVLATKSLTLKDVITEQTESNDSYGKSKNVIGLGVVLNTADAKLNLDNVTQYNWITQKQWSNMLGSYESSFPALFTNDKYAPYRFKYDNTEYVNSGIIYACDITVENFENNLVGGIEGYVPISVTAGGKNGVVYTMKNTSGRELTDADIFAEVYKANTQNPIPPVATFDYITKNNEPAQNGSNDFCYYDTTSNKFLISFDQGESKNWYSDILTVKKGNNDIDYTVSVDGNAVINGDNTITFREAGDYTVTYTYNDTYNYKLSNSAIVTDTVTYSEKIYITVFAVEPEADPTTFAFGDDGYKTVTAGDLNYVMPNVTATKDPTILSNVVKASGIGSKTIDGETIYYPIIGMHKVGSLIGYYNYFSVFEAVTINDAGGTSTYDVNTTTMPNNLEVIGGFIDDGAESANGTAIFNYSTGKTIKTKTVSVNGTNVGLCYYPDSSFSSSTVARAKQTIVVKYKYTDTNGKAYYYYIGYWCAQGKNGIESSGSSGSGPCVTPDTLVTLYDGTTKRIDEVTYNDQLLVWDFYTGQKMSAPSSIIMNHGAGEYEIATMHFSDGTSVNTIGGHGFYDADERKFVILGADNAESYIGHNFTKADGSTVTLVDYSVKTEYTESWSILTAVHYNCVMAGMWTLTPAEVDNSPAYLMPFEIDENMKYVEDKMYADIQQYGMYTYEEFQQYMTMEQFYAFNFPIFKVSVGKGYFTYEDILYLISVHFNVEIQEVTVPYVQAMATSIASLANMPVALVDDSESTTPAEEPQQSEITPPADETVGGDDVTAETPADTTGEANGTDVTDGTQPTDSTEGEDVTVPSSDTGADGEDVAE